MYIGEINGKRIFIDQFYSDAVKSARRLAIHGSPVKISDTETGKVLCVITKSKATGEPKELHIQPELPLQWPLKPAPWKPKLG